jgi:nucleoside-diphosphate-sugar epimerase
MESKVVAVTGANGYVGSVIVGWLLERHRVISLVRSPQNDNDRPWSLSMTEYQMSETLAREDITHIIHAAWEMKTNSIGELQRLSVSGTARLLSAAKMAGVGRFTFISTISAFEGARSAYGKSKLAAEQMVISGGGSVLRLGLVYGGGNGGVFGSLCRMVENHRILPIVGGAADQYLLHEESLSAAISQAVEGVFDIERRVITLAHPQPIPFVKLLQIIAARKGRDIILLPIPWRVLYAALRVAEMLGIRSAFRSDSIVSLVNQNPRPDFIPAMQYQLGMIPFGQPDRVNVQARTE